jgi:hypothetical protein
MSRVWVAVTAAVCVGVLAAVTFVVVWVSRIDPASGMGM